MVRDQGSVVRDQGTPAETKVWTCQQHGAATQGYNAYHYTGNNPTTRTDPTGHDWSLIADTIGAIGFLQDVIVDLVHTMRDVLRSDLPPWVKGFIVTLVVFGLIIMLYLLAIVVINLVTAVVGRIGGLPGFAAFLQGLVRFGSTLSLRFTAWCIGRGLCQFLTAFLTTNGDCAIEIGTTAGSYGAYGPPTGSVPTKLLELGADLISIALECLDRTYGDAADEENPRPRRSSGDGGPCSFAADTGVLMVDGTMKRIAEVNIGDWVLAEDPETGARGARLVTAVWTHADQLVDLEIGGATVTTTEDHPFWNVSDGAWQRADELDPGELVLTADGEQVPVTGIDWATRTGGMAYNLTVAELHTYDALDRVDYVRYVDGGTATFTYDDNGNRTSVSYGLGGTDSFSYDWHNRLTSATVGGSTVDYVYSGDDLRVSRSEGGITETYLWDRLSALPTMVDDGTTQSVHGPTGITTEITGSSASSALPDGLGSVRAWVDSSGNAIGTTDWDAWGMVRSTTGSVGLHGFTGERDDPTTNLVYLRARDYSPGTARFVQPDPLQPNAGGSTGYNPYAYANGNPVAFTDPSGHSVFDNCAGMGPFACLAYVFECFLSGNCLYQSEHGDTMGNELVRGAVSAAEWANAATKRGVMWINTHWPGDYFAWRPPLVPKIPNPIDVIGRGAKSLYDKVFGKDGYLDDWGYETVGICAPSAQLFIPIYGTYDATVCALKDLVGNEGISLSVTGPAGLSFKVATYPKSGSFGFDVAVGLLVSNANTIFELEGWSGTVGGSVFDGWGAAGNVSAGENGVFTYTGKFGAGLAAGVLAGGTYTEVWTWDEAGEEIRDFLDKYL